MGAALLNTEAGAYTVSPVESIGLTEEDLRAELASVGVVLEAPADNAQLAAMASHILGEMADCDAQLQLAADTLNSEIARLQMRYRARTEPIATRRKMLEAYALQLAERVDYGSKKSIAVGNGKLGKRQAPEKITIVDPAAAVAFAEARGLDDAIKIEKKPVHKVLAPAVLELLHREGELPDGFEHEAAHDTYFATPER